MAASAGINIIVELLGLGKIQSFVDRFNLTTTPTRAHYDYRQMVANNTAEAIDLGGVSTVGVIILKAITNSGNVDTSFSSSFNAELSLPAGEISVFKPSGTAYINSVESDEKVTYEYLVIGT